MEKKSTDRSSGSCPTWDDLEGSMRQRIQTWLQDLLVEEVTEVQWAVLSEVRHDPGGLCSDGSHGRADWWYGGTCRY